jgi:hypothetical protein
MKGTIPLVISETKTDRTAKAMTFATLRFAGDALDPQDISDILRVKPWRAHRKGESFYAGQHAGYLSGRTGIWYLSTDKLIDSDNLMDHLQLVEELLYPAPGDNRRVMQLRDVLVRSGAEAHISVFWRGLPGTEPPAIPGKFARLSTEIGAVIELDFHNDDD